MRCGQSIVVSSSFPMERISLAMSSALSFDGFLCHWRRPPRDFAVCLNGERVQICSVRGARATPLICQLDVPWLHPRILVVRIYVELQSEQSQPISDTCSLVQTRRGGGLPALAHALPLWWCFVGSPSLPASTEGFIKLYGGRDGVHAICDVVHLRGDERVLCSDYV